MKKQSILLILLLLNIARGAQAIVPRLVKIFNNTGQTLQLPDARLKTLVAMATSDAPTNAAGIESAADKKFLESGEEKWIWLAPAADIKEHLLVFRKKDSNSLMCEDIKLWEAAIEIQKNGNRYEIRSFLGKIKGKWRDASSCK